MHLKYQLQPWKLRNAPNEKCLMVVDNVSFHHVKEVIDSFATGDWIIKFFPSNMTDELQPMDLIVNAVLKADMRKQRAALVFEAVQLFRAEMLQWSAAAIDAPTLPRPVFDPPKPTYKDAVRIMLDIHKTKLATPQFQASLSKCFEKVGLIPTKEGEYNKYKQNKLGEVKKEDGLTKNDCIAGWIIDFSTPRDDPEVEKEIQEPQDESPAAEAATLAQAEIVDIVSDSDSDNELDDNAVLDIIQEESDGEPLAPISATDFIAAITPADAEPVRRGGRARVTYNKHAQWES